MRNSTERSRSTFFSRVALLISLPAFAAGCDSILSVEDPGSITAEDLDNPALLPALLNIPDAAGMEYHDVFVHRMGMVGNDLIEPNTNAWAIWADQGEFHLQTSTPMNTFYDNLGSATWVIRDVRRRIEALVPNPESHWAIGRSYFWDGHLQVSRADAFEGITFDGGESHTPIEVYKMSLDLLAKSVTILTAAGAAERPYVAAAQATMARVYRSLYFEEKNIAHLNSAAQFAAQALVTQSNFRLDARFVPPGKSNSIFTGNGATSGDAEGVGPIYGDGWIDPVTNTIDPRIGNSVTPLRKVLAGGRSYKQLKYNAANSPIPVSRWQEAVLIIAEHRLVTGDLAAAVTGINQVRAAASRPLFQSTDPARIRTQIIYERETEFFLEGRQWQDARYYGIYPDRWNARARALGLNRRIPISETEVNGQL